LVQIIIVETQQKLLPLSPQKGNMFSLYTRI
jgi:hypothetical protein